MCVFYTREVNNASPLGDVPMKSNRHKLFFLQFTILTACCLATPFPVTENGRAVADIVLSADADVTLRHAADELQLWIKDITGAELPVRSRLESCRGTSGLA